MQERQPSLRCFGCHRELDALSFLREVSVWWPALDAAKRTCRACGHQDEVRLSTGGVELGSLYAAGTAHFAGMQAVAVPGLEVRAGAAGLAITYAGERWTVPAQRLA